MSLLSRFTLISCLLIHTQYFLGNRWVAYMLHGKLPIFYNVIQGLLYLLYPLCGWIADIYANSFTMIKLAFMAMLVSSICLFLSGLWSFLYPHLSYLPAAIFGFFFAVIGIAGLGMYEANAVQFGMDHMLEASSEQLSSFIHHYFWCAQVGPLFLYYLLLATILYVRHCKIHADDIVSDQNHFLGVFLILPATLQILLSSLCLTTVYLRRRYFCVERISKNPLRIVIDVLKYSYHHKYPERRSAFTYWESDIPSRIDLGKQKYGGPFTYEQVEDVKTMFRLLLLMVSLFGFHISGDGYSLSNYVMSVSKCPNGVAFLAVVTNPSHIPLLIGTVAIPLYQLLKGHLKQYNPSLLSKVWFGLFLCLLNEAVQCWYGLSLHESELECPHIDIAFDNTMLRTCINANFKFLTNDSCQYPCRMIDGDKGYFLYLSAIPLSLYGLSNLLVFLTMLEFICAQSPNAMKGLLIGVWYSMLSIKYLAINVLDRYRTLHETVPWFLYHGAKGVAVFLSLIAFSLACKQYHYRERNEIVNEQTMIEDQYARELLLNASPASSSSEESD